MNLDNIILAGLLMAFVLPMIVVVNQTLPAPIINGQPNNNITNQLNSVGIYVNNSITGDVASLQGQLFNQKNQSGFYSSPTVFSAFAFILSGFGTVMTTIIQLPYLDWISMSSLMTGLSTILPGVIVGVLQVGVSLLYLYLAFCLMMLGISMIQKYNVLSSE